MIGRAGPSPVCAFDHDFKVIAFNQAHSDEFFRVYRHRVCIGEVLPDLFLPEQAPIIRRFMARALAGETFGVVEEFGDPELSKPRWDIHYAPLRDESGAVVGAFHLARDIGERLRAEANLDEARLQFAARAGRMGLWELDTQTMELVTSRTCREIFGRDPARPFSYDELRESVHPEDSARMAAEVERSLATGADYEIEYRIVRTGGAVGWVQIRAQVIPPGPDRPARMAGISVDITERKAADTRRAALLALTDRLRELEDPDDIAFATAEIVGSALEVSRAGYGEVNTIAETITIARDWNAPDIRTLAGVLNFRDYGTYIENLKLGETVVVPDARSDPRTRDTADALTAISAAAFVNMPVSEQGGFVALFYLNHEKPRRWTDDELVFVREAANRTRQAVERRRAEQRLAALAESLEQQVEERTAALRETEAALRQSQKMEAVGQLTGGIAHDFNNLLAGITGSLELAERRRREGRIEALPRYLDAAQESATRAAALTQRLLAFSRRQTLDPKATNVNRLVHDMEDLIRRSTGPDIVVDVIGAVGLWPVMIDPHQLENALLNLCINARDAMPDGGRITIETANKWLDSVAAGERDLPPGQYVSLCVTDTGTGMTPDVAARAFDPFFTTKPLGQGTGLGLSMIYGFARQSNGQVRIESEVGKGTTMLLYFPRYSGDAVAEHVVDSSTHAYDGAEGETVLIVDDEEIVRMLMVDVLREAGYRTLEAEDGAAGLRMLQSDVRVDLLITDVGLPGGMNGRQVADAARAIRPNLKVLFVTGYAENAVVANGRLDPGMRIITKPFAIEAFGVKVRDLIDN
jgi:signal transduction histidine kinase/PAS domain-containing protein